VFRVELHNLPVVARQVHKVNLNFKLRFLKFVSATSDMVLLVTARHIKVVKIVDSVIRTHIPYDEWSFRNSLWTP
jgi:hypothetical protein